jgi:hypothetical protein
MKRIAGLVANYKNKPYSFDPHKSIDVGYSFSILKGSALDSIKEGYYLIEGEIVDTKKVKVTKIAPYKIICVTKENDHFLISGNYINDSMKIISVNEKFNTIEEVSLFVKNNLSSFNVAYYSALISPYLEEFLDNPLIDFPKETVISFSSSRVKNYSITIEDTFWNGIYVKEYCKRVFYSTNESGFTQHPEFDVVETLKGVEVNFRNLKKVFSIEELEPTWFSELNKRESVFKDKDISDWTLNPKWKLVINYYNGDDKWNPKKEGSFYATRKETKILFEDTVYKESVLEFPDKPLYLWVSNGPGEWDPRDDDPYYDLNN